MSENSELIKYKIQELELQLKHAKQEEFLFSLKNYKWIADLTKDGKIFIHYEYNDEKYYPKLNDIYNIIDNPNVCLSVMIDGEHKSYVYIFENIMLVYDMNMIIAKSIDYLLSFQKEFKLNIDFEKLKQGCDYEINKAKEDLDTFLKIRNKLK